MVKKFDFRGMQLEELQSMPNDEMFKILNSRQRRSLTRGITDGKRKLIKEIKALKAGDIKNPIKTHLLNFI